MSFPSWAKAGSLEKYLKLNGYFFISAVWMLTIKVNMIIFWMRGSRVYNIYLNINSLKKNMEHHILFDVISLIFCSSLAVFGFICAKTRLIRIDRADSFPFYLHFNVFSLEGSLLFYIYIEALSVVPRPIYNWSLYSLHISSVCFNLSFKRFRVRAYLFSNSSSLEINFYSHSLVSSASFFSESNLILSIWVFKF